MDNIADPHPTPAQDVESSVDDYLRRFDLVESSMERMSVLAAGVAHQPHDEARIRALTDCVLAQQKINANLYDLLVEMNNYFSAAQ